MRFFHIQGWYMKPCSKTIQVKGVHSHDDFKSRTTALHSVTTQRDTAENDVSKKLSGSHTYL